LKGYRFVLALDSLVYHIGSLTSRGTEESVIAHGITRNVFLKKWKTTFEHFKQFSMLKGLEYVAPNAHITVNNPDKQLEDIINLINTPSGSIQVMLDGVKFDQKDLDCLLLLPYIVQGLEPQSEYQVGNIIIKT
jgi:hypothetical protein